MPSIRDFSGGVMNQELLGKDGGAGIMIDANNVLSSWNGELRKRTGSRIIAQLEKKSRIIPYRLPNNDDALLVFTDGNVKGYKITDSGLSILPKAETTKLVYPTQGWPTIFEEGFGTNGDWSVNSYAQESILSMGFFSGQSMPLGDFTLPIWIQFTNKTSFAFNSINLRTDIDAYSGGRTCYFSDAIILYSDDEQSWHEAKSSSSENFVYVDSSISKFYINITTHDVTEHRYWRVQFNKKNGAWDQTRNVVLNVEALDVSIDTASPFSFSTVYSQEDLSNIKFAQSGNNMFFACKNKTPSYIYYIDKNFSSGVFNPLVEPSETLEPVRFVEKYGEPSAVSAFQNRLCFAGFEKYKNRVVLSEFGKLDNFLVKTTDVKSTDPISADSVELRAPIENLWAGNNALYALSSDGVSMIDAQGGVIATDQISFKLRNREPADGMTPTTKDDVMIYLGNDRRKIFITDYDFIVQRFKAKDLSVGYNGFLTSRIVALHYTSRKCSLIYGYKDDGNMLALLFDVDMQKNALFPLDIGGDIKDMQVFKSGDKFRVLMVAQIEDRWYLIEKNEQPEYTVMDFMSEEQKSAYTQTIMSNGLYLDYMTRRYYSEPVDIIENVPYGLGEQVAVFADGHYIGEHICSAGGPYAWKNGNELIYTLKARPEEGDLIYNSDNQVIEHKTVVSSTANDVAVKRPKKLYAWSDSVGDRYVFTSTQTPKVGDDAYYYGVGKIRVIETGTTEHPDYGNDVAYIKTDANPLIFYRYAEKDTDKHSFDIYETENYVRSVIDDKSTGPIGIRLETPASDFILGYNYDAYAVLKLATPYTSKKYPKEVATYLINTGYLEIGNSFDNLQPILNNMKDKLDLFDKPTLLNGEYTKTMDKLDNSPYIILRSNEPMPFMITGIDFKVDYSNYQGGI